MTDKKTAKIALIKRYHKMGLSLKAAKEAAAKAIENGKKTS